MQVMLIKGMQCQHCVGAVTRALQEVEGVEQVEVDLEKGEARVTGGADPKALSAAVTAKGFTVESP